MMYPKAIRNVASKRQEGFSLPELMVTICIIGILLAVGMGGYRLMRPTRNFHAENRDLLSSVRMARVEAVTRGACVGVVFQPPLLVPPVDYAVFVDDGTGGGAPCNGQYTPGEPIIAAVRIRQEIALVPSPIAPTGADPNQADLFSGVSFNQRSLVAVPSGRDLTRGVFVLRNDTNAANATLWSRIVVLPSGSVVLQTNNNPANEADWN